MAPTTLILEMLGRTFHLEQRDLGVFQGPAGDLTFDLVVSDHDAAVLLVTLDAMIDGDCIVSVSATGNEALGKVKDQMDQALRRMAAIIRGVPDLTESFVKVLGAEEGDLTPEQIEEGTAYCEAYEQDLFAQLSKWIVQHVQRYVGKDHAESLGVKADALLGVAAVTTAEVVDCLVASASTVILGKVGSLDFEASSLTARNLQALLAEHDHREEGPADAD